MKAVLRTDGGSRGNPGPAGIGFVLERPDGHAITCGGRFLGDATNNIAEYEALLWGMRVALERGVTELTVFADSELLVKQMNGVYRVKHPNMVPLYRQAQALSARFRTVRVRHVRRAENTVADRLANEAMDARSDVGDVCDAEGSAVQGSLFGEEDACTS